MIVPLPTRVFKFMKTVMSLFLPDLFNAEGLLLKLVRVISALLEVSSFNQFA